MIDPRDDVRMWQPSKHASCEIYTLPLPATGRKQVLQTNRPEDRDKVLAMRDALVAMVKACSPLYLDDLCVAYNQAKAALGEEK
jgi:hypothetical protein